MKNFKHLTYEQRCNISILYNEGYTQAKIANKLNVSQSTISRELSRNSKKGYYNCNVAQNYYQDKIFYCRAKRYKIRGKVKRIIDKMIKKHFSPEQISGRLAYEGFFDISFKSIYNYIYRDKNNGGMLYKSLRFGGKKYKKRYKNTTSKFNIKNRVSINERPTVVEEKSRKGDLEVDLVIGKNHSGALVTIVDKKTRFMFSKYVKNKSATLVTNAIIELLKPFKKVLHTITSDNGKEFAYHEKIAKKLAIKFYFADPYSSWQRGLNENTNGLLRQYFPKNSNFHNITQSELQAAVNLINDRPRKILEFKSAREVMFEKNYKYAV